LQWRHTDPAIRASPSPRCAPGCAPAPMRLPMSRAWTPRPARSRCPRLERLEDRTAPAAANYAALIHRPYTAGEVLASVRAADPLSAVAAAARSGRLDPAAVDLAASRLLARDRGAGLVEVALRPGTNPLAVLGQLQALPNVQWVSPNFVYAAGPEFTPNDPQFGVQTNLTQM